METLCFPLLLMIAFLLQSIQSSTEDAQAKNRMFKKVKGLENIFKFFGEEMDEKAKFVIFQWDGVLNYHQTNPTFISNQPCQMKWDKFPVDHKNIEDSIRYEVGKEEPILVGLDNLLVRYNKKNGETYLSRTGVVNAGNNYYIFTRILVLNDCHKQYFKRIQILKHDKYVFWNDEHLNGQIMSTFWIHSGDNTVYHRFYFTLESEVSNAFVQIDSVDIFQYDDDRPEDDGALSAQEIVAQDPQIILKPHDRKTSEESTTDSSRSKKSLSHADAYKLPENSHKYQDNILNMNMKEEKMELQKDLVEFLTREEEDFFDEKKVKSSVFPKDITLSDLQGKWVDTYLQNFTVTGKKVHFESGKVYEIEEKDNMFIIREKKDKKFIRFNLVLKKQSNTFTWTDVIWPEDVVWYRRSTMFQQQEGMEYIQSTMDSNLNQSQNEEDFKDRQDKSQDDVNTTQSDKNILD